MHHRPRTTGQRHRLLIGSARLSGLLVAIVALFAGLELRSWLWQATTPVRFYGDINNGFRQASRVLQIAGELQRTAGAAPTPGTERLPLPWVLRGVRETYERVHAQGRQEQRYSLDYTVARLTIMTLWLREARHAEIAAGRSRPREYRDQIIEPLLMFNTLCSVMAAAGAFGLVRFWLNKQALATPAGWRNEWVWIGALLAAVGVWFSPPMLLVGHAWPQWDLWLLPWFFVGAWAASAGRWATAGVLLGIGAMLKGQILLTMPALAVWALLAGGIPGLVRLIAGFVLGWSLFVWPWLVRGHAGWTVVALSALAGGLFGAMGRWRGMSGSHGLGARLGSGLTAAMLAAGLGVFAAGVLYHGSWSWYEIGFAFPTNHYREMSMGPTSNLPAIMGQLYGWQVDSLVPLPAWLVSAVPASTGMTMRQLLRGIYFVSALSAGVGLALAARRRDAAGVFYALTAVWVVAFAVLPQMHERYLIWGAVVSGLCLAVSPRAAMLHLLTLLLATVMIGHQLLNTNPQAWPIMHHVLQQTCPHLGWVVLVVAAMWLWLAIFGHRPAGGRAAFPQALTEQPKLAPPPPARQRDDTTTAGQTAPVGSA